MTEPQSIVALVDLDAVCSTFGVTRQTIRRWWLAGRFPQPIRIGRRRLLWRVADINAAIASQAGQQEEKENENVNPVAKPAGSP
jgi:predicted DNA-binding transcriptional regulator AlpA